MNTRSTSASRAAAACGLFAALIVAAPALGQETLPQTPTSPPTTAPAKDLPPAKMIIDRALDAAGGEAAMRKIKQIKYTVTAVTQGNTTKMNLRSAGPEKLQVTADTPRGPIEMGRVGKIAWTNTGTGFNLVPETQIGQVSQLDLYGLMVTLPGRVEQFRTVDRVPFNELDCYKVQLANEPSGTTFGYFDSAGGAMVGIDQSQGPMFISTIFSDTQKVAPLSLFTKATMTAGGMPLATLAFSDVEFNPADDYEITVPVEVQALAAERSKPTSRPATTRPAVKPTTQPADGETTLSPQYQQAMASIQRMLDPGQLRMMSTMIEAQMAQMSEEEQQQMKALIGKINDRIAELEGK